ncbi:hypothetical protein HNR26_004771 [Rhizobium rosettiformans]|uniref:Uncharacterized protein n=1 Tax=Rhizobium rosettiformans TaxID=1368430 RepID=A0A7W8MFT6_9HYPH|nr:hypothetical protein [Rhizobium rosettiformans]
MSSRRGELTRSQIDRDWPHKILILWNEDRSLPSADRRTGSINTLVPKMPDQGFA